MRQTTDILRDLDLNLQQVRADNDALHEHIAHVEYLLATCRAEMDAARDEVTRLRARNDELERGRRHSRFRILVSAVRRLRR